MTTNNRIPNRLAKEKSPYLLQHANNPVHWYPWGEEAFNKARAEDKAIFLSIGYSTCHWCHVMERESFEQEDVAEILNKYFVSIKVDREERPDIDHIYMSACQAVSGHGGWPLTIIMTPDKKPFYAATYLPKENKMGMMGLKTLLTRVEEMWQHKRSTILESVEEILKAITPKREDLKTHIDPSIVNQAYREFKEDFDKVYGGFGRAPKFPTPHNLYFLLTYWQQEKEPYALEMVEKTLESMYKGGIYDHIGYGFTRYSTDKKWLVPHFEKMLYDNALIAMAYIKAYEVTNKKQYKEIAEEIFTYILRDMTSKEGGFYSAEDADSEGEEGKFYVWTPEEIKKLLGVESGEKFCKYFNITEKGNFEGKSIPNLIDASIPQEEEGFITACKEKLYIFRDKRVHPHKDDKILTSWNGLMIAALALGGKVFQNETYTSAAAKGVSFIYNNLIGEEGRLLARYREGEAAIPAFVDDYAFLVWGLIELYEGTSNEDYLKKAISLNEDLLKYFWDEEEGGLFIYGSDSEELIIRPKEIYDGATPSGNSVTALNLITLGKITNNKEYKLKALEILNTFGKDIMYFPRGYTLALMCILCSK